MKTLHATPKFCCKLLQRFTNLAATHRNFDKISRNFTATFAKIGRIFLLIEELRYTATFSKQITATILCPC